MLTMVLQFMYGPNPGTAAHVQGFPSTQNAGPLSLKSHTKFVRILEEVRSGGTVLTQVYPAEVLAAAAFTGGHVMTIVVLLFHHVLIGSIGGGCAIAGPKRDIGRVNSDDGRPLSEARTTNTCGFVRFTVFPPAKSNIAVTSIPPYIWSGKICPLHTSDSHRGVHGDLTTLSL